MAVGSEMVPSARPSDHVGTEICFFFAIGSPSPPFVGWWILADHAVTDGPFSRLAPVPGAALGHRDEALLLQLIESPCDRVLAKLQKSRSFIKAQGQIAVIPAVEPASQLDVDLDGGTTQ